MSESAPSLPLSVLELATVGTGQSSADALAATARVAQAADRLGYTRLWVAEHHNMPAVASTSPPVLIAHLAAVTERIRVGSGGVMLPNHAPLVVAEQFAMLEALHPGRIDLGIGRAPGHRPADRARAAPRPRRAVGRGLPAAPAGPARPARRRAGRGRAGGAVRRDPGRARPPRRSCCSAPAASPRSWPARSGCRSTTPTTSARHAQAAVELYRDSFRPSPRARPAVHDDHRERAGGRHRRGGAAAGPPRAADDAGHPHEPAAAGAEPGRGRGRPGAGRRPRPCRPTAIVGAPDARGRPSCAGSPPTPAPTRSWSRPARTARPSGCAAWSCSRTRGAWRRPEDAPAA